MKFLAEIEDQMLECLSRSEVRLMNDLNTTKQLAELKKQYNETLERYGKPLFCTWWISV